MSLMRWDIINHLIKKIDAKRYLEIGYYKGWSFESVICENKTAVDPNPSRIPQHEVMVYGSLYIDYEEGKKRSIYKKTSDDYFSESATGDTWDVIFIDGLHEAEQVKRDIENSLKHLAPGGYIVLHDMNPPLEEHTKGGIDGCWTGDCYIAILDYYGETPFVFHVVDTDWGVGVLQPLSGNFFKMNMKLDLDFEKAKEDWNYFDQNRKELMNIISVEEFLNKY